MARVVEKREQKIYSGEINIPSSIGPDTPEVKSMAEQVEEEGRPVPLYEFAQGMVDYGKNNQPAPRIFLVYANGQRVEFTGKSVWKGGVQAVEFTNSGKGLAPEEAAIVRHGGDDKTLGVHGRGTKIASAYLASKGMPVEMESNYEGQGWEAKNVLVPTHTGLSETITVKGEWTGEPSNQTVFRVNNPDDTFLKQLENFPDYFLEANPDFPEASIVAKNPDAPRPLLNLKLFDRAEVVCLEGIVDWDKISDHTSVYVDRLRVDGNKYGGKFLLPWSISGFRDIQYPLTVKRSHDSRKVGEGSPELVVQAALHLCTETALFERLLGHAVEKEALSKATKETPDLPLEIRGNFYQDQMKWGPKAAETLLAVWKEKYDDAYVAVTSKDVASMQQRQPDAKVFVVHGAMYQWLKEVGARTVADAIGRVASEEIQDVPVIKVEYARDPEHRLEKLFTELGRSLGTMKLVVAPDGTKSVEALFPYTIANYQDLNDREKPGAAWARVAAIVGKMAGFTTDLRSRLGGKQTMLRFDVHGYGQDSFYTKIHADTYTWEELSAEDFPNGLTAITLAGDALQNLEPPENRSIEELTALAEKAAQDFLAEQARLQANIPRGKERIVAAQRAVEEAQLAIRNQLSSEEIAIAITKAVEMLTLAEGDVSFEERVKLKKAKQALEKAGDDAVKTQKALEAANKSLGRAEQGVTPADALREEIKKPDFELDRDITESIGSAASHLGVHEVNYRDPSNRIGKEKRDNPYALEINAANGRPGGYYRRFMGTAFVRNHETSRGQWVADESYESVYVASRAPKRHVSELSRKLTGESRFMIREGEIIVAIVSANGSPIEVKREKRSGNYVLRGFSEKVTVYTALDAEQRHKHVPPVAEEQLPLVEFNDLDQKWQHLIASLRSDMSLSIDEKARQIQAAWGGGFVYDDNSALDKQVVGETTAQIAAQIVQKQRGICNIAASGLAILYRMAGIPSRTMSGYYMDDEYNGDTHMWDEYWNGEAWVSIESQTGSSDGRKMQFIAPRSFGEVVEGVKQAAKGMTRRKFLKLAAVTMAGGVGVEGGTIVGKKISDTLASTDVGKKIGEALASTDVGKKIGEALGNTEIEKKAKELAASAAQTVDQVSQAVKEVVEKTEAREVTKATIWMLAGAAISRLLGRNKGIKEELPPPLDKTEK